MNVFDQRPGIKELAYGALGRERRFNPIRQGVLFRVERSVPVQKAGSLIPIAPQFKTETLFSPTTTAVKTPATKITPVVINPGGRYSAHELL